MKAYGESVFEDKEAAAASAKVGALRSEKELAFAKKGLVFGALSGFVWAVASVLLLGQGITRAPYTQPEFWILGPLLAAGIHDFFAAITGFLINCARGQGREVWRTFVNKAGRYCLLGALFGSPLGMGGYLLGMSLAGPAYVLPITSLYPAIAAVLALFFLKERISRRAWIGLFACVVGAFIINYAPPESGPSDYFYLGMIFACISAFGWAAEGVLVTSSMDFVEPGVALNVYQITSSFLYAFIIIPLALQFTLPEGVPAMQSLASLFDSSAVWLIAAAGVVGCVGYCLWYKALNMTGVSRAMALNITYALWGVILSAVFLDVEITVSLVLGALVIFGGMVLVIGNPKDIVNLRKLD